MVRYNIKRFITAIAGLAIVVFICLCYFRGELGFDEIGAFWGNFSSTITIVAFISTFFVKWAWKWGVFQDWLVTFPCLTGDWTGEIRTIYQGNEKIMPIGIRIKHTFFNVQIRISTNESSSNSTCASFDIDEDRGLKQLIYTYQNIPKSSVRDRSEIHFGSVRLDINETATILEGEYWTSRKTTGEIKFNKSTSDVVPVLGENKTESKVKRKNNIYFFLQK